MFTCRDCTRRRKEAQRAAPRKNWCRACRQKYNRAYDAANHVSTRAKQRRYEASKPQQAKARKRRYYRRNVDSEKARSAAYYAENALRYSFLAARRRAARLGLPFTILFEDLVVPAVCPVLGLRLAKGTRKRHDNSPSLDRVIPAKGYVPGNVAIISLRANTLKNSGTAEEHQRIADWMGQWAKET